MACLDHSCRDCDEMWEDNRSGGDCPACGSSHVAMFFDGPMIDEPLEDEEGKAIRTGIYRAMVPLGGMNGRIEDLR